MSGRGPGRHDCRSQQHRIAASYFDGAVGLGGKLTGLQSNQLAADLYLKIMFHYNRYQILLRVKRGNKRKKRPVGAPIF